MNEICYQLTNKLVHSKIFTHVSITDTFIIICNKIITLLIFNKTLQLNFYFAPDLICKTLIKQQTVT